MSRFIQLHLLVSYPPSNPNRDDLGRPKTAVMGGANRLRISSQSLKRAWRQSDIFSEALTGNKGVRTKSMGIEVQKSLVAKGVPEKKAIEYAASIAGVFGKNKAKDKGDPYQELEIEQMAHIGPSEQAAIDALTTKLAREGGEPSESDLALLRKENGAADIALFGRMLASSPAFNMDASVQVAHAISVHKVAVEDDFFTAVDDLNKGDEDRGSGHMGDTEFAAALFYLYVCIDQESLIKNLGGDTALANKTLAALTEAIAKVPPGGKQNSFGNRVYASYILAEKGNQQPRSLSVSYLKPVSGEDIGAKSIRELEETRGKMDKVYGPCADQTCRLDATQGEGSMAEIIRFIQE